ncbi:helix-turn-helix transcriptional regulator [Staphylococcus epidermidis]|jgi:transcriptional regulator with XRE-family HTH domain|uniref:Repressor protein CI n=1 Tax=Staphylococcus phage HS09 TaxID=3056401 RepID=A0AA49X4X4_9VIRU|nr:MULTISPECIES: helix-turn-helix transcriptional regulator [Staphylococcus]MDU5197860.1 helix-turn-helix transcriptional regulator [Enterobacter sichuanensis]WEU70764.1 transcriptional regulator [Staphylococcus phage vB_SepS_BE28]WLJ25786.1 MAG: repressor protein CI [Staphylococcus phage HS09]KAB2275181.1 helix-turn-helix transcriptional regulator [Staphylococcus epidermidis]MBM0826182.1 XRE family transcriptional regulator [Staphylococcus epidermidis]
MAKKILSKNLKNLLERKGKTQTDMAKDLDLKESTVSSWINAVKYPRRDKIELLADYFGVMPSDITEDKTVQQDTMAAHFDKDGLTEEEIEEVNKFIEWIKNRDK